LNFTINFFVDTTASDKQIKALELENSKLQAEVATLQSKLEMQQHHAGGLGAAMLQERLEAQQRHIAVLELAKKVSVTQNTLAALTLTLSHTFSSQHHSYRVWERGGDYLVMLSLAKNIVSGK
jgi:predicted RNase H-like nuclease (RuvC/YqgF family)